MTIRLFEGIRFVFSKNRNGWNNFFAAIYVRRKCLFHFLMSSEYPYPGEMGSDVKPPCRG